MVTQRWLRIVGLCFFSCGSEKGEQPEGESDSASPGGEGVVEEDSGVGGEPPAELSGEISWRVSYEGRLECEVSWAVTGTPRELPCPDCAYTIERMWDIQLGEVRLEDDPRCMESAFVVIGGDPAYLESAMNTYGNSWAFVNMGGEQRALIGYVYQGIDYQVLDYSFSGSLTWEGSGDFEWSSELGEIYYAYPYEPGAGDTGEGAASWGMVSVTGAGRTP